MIDDTTTSDSASESSSVGRFSRAQLEAMHGKAGRKPAEYYVLYPKAGAPKAKKVKAEKPAKAKKVKAEKPAKAKKVKAAKAEKPAKILKLKLGKLAKIAKPAKRGRKPRTVPGGLVAKALDLIGELRTILADPTLVSYIEASDHDRRVISAALKAAKG